MTTAVDIDPTILAERERIQGMLGDRTIIDYLADTVAKVGDQPAYSDRHRVAEGESWRTLTWSQMQELAKDVAAGLISLGVQPGDRVALMGTNRIEHFAGDMGAVHAAGIGMSIYNTLSPSQVAFVINESRPVVAILENEDHLYRWSQAIDDRLVEHVIMMEPQDGYMGWDELVEVGKRRRASNPDELEQRAQEVHAHSPATILYTSGTTGDPKGVVLTHHNVMYEAISTMEAAGFQDPQRMVSYLPLAHIAERVLGLYGPQILGSHTYTVGDPNDLVPALGEVHPTAFFGVPRVWEKIKTGVSAQLAAETDPEKAKMVQEAMAAGQAWVAAQEYGNTMTPEIEAAYKAADEAILGFLRLLLGLDQVKWAASAAAPMPEELARFIAGLGIIVYDVYGMSETTGAVTVNGPGSFKLGTVGRPTPGMEVKLAEDGEILMRGPVVTPGYFNREEETRQVIDADGWIHSGDIGSVDADGFYTVIDRKKELIITSSGKNIAPSNIENYLKESPIIGHAMAVGDGKPYVVAILTLDGEIAPLIAANQGIEFTDLADLATKPEILAMAQQAVDSANERLARPEQIKKWTLLPVEWTAESAELTPTLKLKRRVVTDNYAAQIKEMYAN